MPDGRREDVYTYTHETDCWVDFLYIFDHDKKKGTDYMEIHQKKADKWLRVLVIDLSLSLPDFEKLEKSL